MENTIDNKSKFYALYWDQKVWTCPHWSNTYKVNEYFTEIGLDNIREGEHSWNIDGNHLLLTPISQISDEDAIEVARILYGESDNFAIEFNAAGITSVSPYGLPCYGNTIDINWSGEVSYEVASSMSILKAYDFLRSRGYALPFHNLSVEDLIKRKWIVLKNGNQ